ncbi:MAG TPA: hypothetical protein VF318_02360 [Dehalococcoidales bacterium]|jgi:hypothetical protein
MDTNQRKILEMLADKKISVDEAERLLSLTVKEPPAVDGDSKINKPAPKYLRVEVRPAAGNKSASQDNVNIRVPITLLRSGMKFASLVPPEAYAQVDSALREKGLRFDLRNMKPEDFDKLLYALNDLEIDIHDGMETVRMYTE